MRSQAGGPALLLFVPLALAVAALGQLVGTRLLFLACGALLAIPLIALTARRPPLLDVALPALTRCAVGETVTQQVTFANHGSGVYPAGQVQLTTPGLTEALLWCPQLRPGQSAVALVERTALARGVAERSHLHLLACDPFDLRSNRRSLDIEHRTIVHPPSAAAVASALAGTGGDSLPSSSNGTDVAGVRHWTPGDSQRAVHWRATARSGRLVVADRREPLRRCLRAVVVGDRLGASAEAALAVVVASAVEALAGGADVRLLWAGAQGIVQAPTGSRGAVRDWAARIAPVDAVGTSAVAASTTAPGGPKAVLPQTTALPGGPKAVLPQTTAVAVLPETTAVAARLRFDRSLLDGGAGAPVWLVVADQVQVQWLRRLQGQLRCVDPLTGQPLELPR